MVQLLKKTEGVKYTFEFPQKKVNHLEIHLSNYLERDEVKDMPEDFLKEDKELLDLFKKAMAAKATAQNEGIPGLLSKTSNREFTYALTEEEVETIHKALQSYKTHKLSAVYIGKTSPLHALLQRFEEDLLRRRSTGRRKTVEKGREG